MTVTGEKQFRYERKFMARGTNREEIEAMVMLHPSFFRRLHVPRVVNNVYFDDFEFSFFKENVEGDSQRNKVRIRWYGELTDVPAEATLELKSRFNQAGSKDHFSVKDFDLKRLGDQKKVDSWLEECTSLPKLIRKSGTLRPTLINSYRRSYFLSADGKYRVTVDDELRFLRPFDTLSGFIVYPWEDRTNVIELKYAMEDDDRARDVASAFQFRLSKMSKYVAGVYQLYMT
jgi:SPX domain protein involved in polyphosphate accumulation